MKKLISLLIITPMLISCSSKKHSYHPEWVKDTNGFNILMGQFANDIEQIWGNNEVLIAGPKDYVKYSDNYYTRSHINFDSGTIAIETIAGTDPLLSLRQAIITTLLISDEPGDINLYSDANDINISKEPLLYSQVLDNTGQPIRWQGRAASFADYLITNKLQKRTSGLHIIWSITIPMVPNHLDKRANKYLPLIHEASEKYGVEQSLILAIMQIESSFNPYAVSGSDALGLMQVVQDTAGADVFRMKGKWGNPSRSYLLDPENNIDAGVAYLALLQENYLAAIDNPISRRYAVISAYNDGAGSVIRSFSEDKTQAFMLINALTSSEVYERLTTSHPSLESRRYLYKVDSAQRRYWRY